jgi:hypothetical protein
MRISAIEAMALVEALIDFGEDEGISEGVFEQGALVLASFLPCARPNYSPFFTVSSPRKSPLPPATDHEVPRRRTTRRDHPFRHPTSDHRSSECGKKQPFELAWFVPSSLPSSYVH